MDFSEALTSLKAGKRVARAGWNGKGMWLVLVEAKRGGHWINQAVYDTMAYIGMKPAGDGVAIVPWLCSQTDMLAEDWQAVG